MKLKFVIDKKYDIEMVHDMKMGKKDLDWLKEQYELCSGVLEYSKKEYQKAWDEIGSEFLDFIEKTTGYKWFYKNYFCVISLIHPGISNWGYEPKIVRWWRENSYEQRRITAHELILSHYFEIYNHHYKNYGLAKNQVWALAEISAYALCSLTPEWKKFWPWDTWGYTYNHNYPQIVDLQKKLKQIFLRRKNFDEYILKGIELVKKIRI